MMIERVKLIRRSCAGRQSKGALWADGPTESARIYEALSNPVKRPSASARAHGMLLSVI